MEATASKPRRGRPARAGAPMASFTLHLPADVIALLDDEAKLRSFANRASLIRVALFMYLQETATVNTSPEYAIRIVRALQALMRTSIAEGDLGADTDYILAGMAESEMTLMAEIASLFGDPDAEEKEAESEKAQRATA